MGYILIVDDESTIRFLLRTLVEFSGHRVVEAESGQIALDQLLVSDQAFNIVLLDMLMPDMNGIEFLTSVQAQIPAPPPVVVVSAHENRIPNTLVHLVKEYFSKPFSNQKLMACVNSLLAVA
ncbi:MAG: response regulator [Phototrophicaceae bacterium]|jgi:DNA-binding response OmpR family regulator